MKKTFMTLALAAVCCLGVSAQEKLFNSASVISPVVNPDGTVTFNLYAPKAIKVEVTGDFLPTQPIEVPGYGKYDAPGVAQLVEGQNGVWSYTSDKLAPEMYSYTFNIDGLTGVRTLPTSMSIATSCHSLTSSSSAMRRATRATCIRSTRYLMATLARYGTLVPR